MLCIDYVSSSSLLHLAMPSERQKTMTNKIHIVTYQIFILSSYLHCGIQIKNIIIVIHENYK